jgi:hypothetical protein
MRRVILSAVAIAASLVPLWTLDAAAQAPPIAPIGKHQFFDGLVNGSSGPAVIHMACFGPEPVGGRLGHPLAGQSSAVTQVPPTSPGAIVPGFTGLADSIEATLYFPTPVVGPPAAGGVRLALFDFYGEPVPISTEVELPCSGSGVVVFNPVEGGKSARPADVAVSFVGQP